MVLITYNYLLLVSDESKRKIENVVFEKKKKVTTEMQKTICLRKSYFSHYQLSYSTRIHLIYTT